MADDIGKRADNRPILTRLPRRENSSLAKLHAAFGIDVDTILFRVGGARQNDIGAMRAGIAVMALIDDEGIAQSVRVDLVGAKQVNHGYSALAGSLQEDRKSTRLNSSH